MAVDMEHLTKQQITLLCLLVALFTSITTSVITASLFDDTSQGVSQTILRVVEKTIQEVAPKTSPTKEIDPPKKEVKDVPVQLPLSDIVENANKSLVSIYSKSGTEVLTYVSSGVVAGANNSIIVFNGQSIFDGTTYVIKTSDGKTLQMIKNTDIVMPSGMSLLVYKKDEVEKPKLTGLIFSSFANEKLASNVIALGAKEQNNVVSTGIINEFPQESLEPLKVSKNIAITDIRLSSPSSGWILLNSTGNLIGFLTSQVEGDKGARYLNAEQVKLLSKDLF